MPKIITKIKEKAEHEAIKLQKTMKDIRGSETTDKLVWVVIVATVGVAVMGIAKTEFPSFLTKAISKARSDFNLG